jgi:hypothetical protein
VRDLRRLLRTPAPTLPAIRSASSRRTWGSTAAGGPARDASGVAGGTVGAARWRRTVPRVRPTLGIDVAAPDRFAWAELTELSCWPLWGPTVRAARLDDGSLRMSAGASGSVQTSVGLWIPFAVSEWSDEAPRRSWSWRVAGVPATSHAVLTLGPARCRVEMSVPWWAPGYLGVVAVALRRIRRRAEARQSDGSILRPGPADVPPPPAR